jgi:glycosyltransferase involved in cell wall biosynthesis
MLAVKTAPRRLLAFNPAGERHHVRWNDPLASWLFCRGVPLDRIYLRPAWWPWARERSRPASKSITLQGRPLADRPRVAIVSPYFPWPLSHGGAVRIHAMLGEAARDFDLFLYCFAEPGAAEQAQPVLASVHQAVLFEMPRYREPRWASMEPPEVREFRSPALEQRLQRDRAAFRFTLLQAEYSQLAIYDPDVLVEHDVTFDLYGQMHRRRRRLGSWWDWWRWRRFEQRAVAKARRVVVMSEKDRDVLSAPHARVLPNGVDLTRFQPSPEPAGARVLFIGSFRHFPNVSAFRFFWEEVWPIVRAARPDASLEVVAGPDPLRYWPQAPSSGGGLTIHGFVADVVPLYRHANIVIAPTLESAGTNLKVLEAMAMCRAVIATPSGCAGLELVHGESVWVAAAEGPAFASAVIQLLDDAPRRARIAAAARRIAEDRYDWRSIGRAQAALWREVAAENEQS